MKNTYEFATVYMQTWIEAMENNALQMPSMWKKSHQWTVAHMANILYPLAEKLKYGEKNNYGITMQQEYYRVDFSLYSYFAPSVWTLDFAVEHENDQFALNKDGAVRKNGWFNEFVKLLPLKCAKSRVIIGYDTFEDQFTVKFKKCIDLLNNPNIQESLTDSSILLIILPYTEYMKNKNYSNGLVNIIEFEKTNKTWQMNVLTEKVCDEKTKERLINAYRKIALASK